VHYRTVSWSHTGTQLAYASDAAGQYDIYTNSATGGAETRWTNHAARDESPSWLAADNGLIFASYRDTAGGAGIGNYSNLWLVATPLGQAELDYNPTGFDAPSCPAGAGNCSSRNPDVSAAGKIIYQFDTTCQTQGGGQAPPLSTCSNLFVIYSAGPAVAVTSGVNYYISPRWNTAGDQIIFVETLTTGSRLLKMPITGVTPGQITDPSVAGTQADF
jgi:Tol biopolymer transport system component